MIKLASTNGKVYAELPKDEFSLLARALPKDVADGANVDLTWIKTILAQSRTPVQLLTSTREQLVATVKMIDELQKAIPTT